ncbi:MULTISPECIES: hypothetical protein [unclassified Flavobacterium]|uniref:hypothetical protein n=1 Tax=unclassified Flavobacterium TaxID=196869 RepID=UPI001F13FD20|nr:MULTISPECIES: hypothetical protein [unclassified Flavobacterium]UMY66768.1 hypothetical protein MKO97_05130 [Flavobacterium sp. HJ-32-4]
MKKLFLKFNENRITKSKSMLLVCCLVSVFGLTSCDATSDKMANQESKTMSYRLSPKSGEAAIYSFRGQTEFRITEDDIEGKELTAYFVDGGRVNFVVFQNADFQESLEDGLYDIDVYAHGVTLFNQVTKNSIFIGIDDATSLSLLENIGSGNFDSVNTSGAGFVFNWGTSETYQGKDLKSIKESGTTTLRVLHSLVKDITVSGDDDCDSGGEGSSSCSTTVSGASQSHGCSVSCKTGYYACCSKGGFLTSESCKCKKEKK